MQLVKLNHHAEWLEKNERILIPQLKAAIESALQSMGHDVNCIDWFCSKAELNIAQKYRKTA